jgi:hypothetical protein
MKKQKQKADNFIDSHIQAYGLTGSNTPHNEDKFSRQRGSSALYFSKKNHFIWGYNGKSFINRRSSTCMYFTDYLKQPSTGSTLPLSFSLVDVAEQIASAHAVWESPTVVNRGRFEDYAFIGAHAAAGAKFEQLVLRYGNNAVPFDPAISFAMVDITPEILISVARSVAPWLRTKSINVIQDIAILKTMVFDEQLIFPSRMKFVNHNHDGDNICGPAYWALCDAEEDTALMRYDWFEDGHTRVTANLATWSPELIASQLDHPILKNCLMNNDAANADLATTEMWRSVSPLPNEAEIPDWWDEVQEEINEIHDGGKYNEKWHTPLYRLLDNVGVSYPQGVTDESYGAVF